MHLDSSIVAGAARRFARFVGEPVDPPPYCADLGPCLPWTGARDRHGYGQIYVARRQHDTAHRVAFVLGGGVLPPGGAVLHRCDRPWCVAFAHLWAGTKAENSADMAAKGRSIGGERNPQARLTEADVAEVRALAAAGMYQRRIAARFGIGQPAVSRIVRGRRWRSA